MMSQGAIRGRDSTQLESERVWEGLLVDAAVPVDQWRNAMRFFQSLQQEFALNQTERGRPKPDPTRLCQYFLQAWLASLDKAPQVSPANLVALFPAWNSHLSGERSPLDLEIPWMNYAAIDYLSGITSTVNKVFEYGCGGSTLFFCGHAKSVVSIEHDKEWAEKVNLAIRKRGFMNATVKWLPPEPLGGSSMVADDGSNPDAYRSTDELFKNHTFKAYASAIDSYADHSFDLVIVDGRARPSCLAHSLPKIVAGGLLVLDNSDRTYYLRNTRVRLEAAGYTTVLDVMGPCPCIPHFCRTTIWRRDRF